MKLEGFNNILVKLCNINSIVVIGYFLFLHFCFGNHVGNSFCCNILKTVA